MAFVKFFVKCGEDELTDFDEKDRGVKEGRILSAYLFNIFNM
jgi:hypothetical protein